MLICGMLSPLAKPSTTLGYKMLKTSPRRIPLYGITLHTTGSGIPKLSGGDKKESLERAVRYYTSNDGPHYVIGWGGEIIALIDDENSRGTHIGVDPEEQAEYDAGTWVGRMSLRGLQLWKFRWPEMTSPKELIPTKKYSNINDAWVGIEMIPVTDGKDVWYKPYKGTRFSYEQHEAARKLIHDIAKRHKFPSNWMYTARLLGHSDLNPIDRDTVNLPLWDPGYHTGLFDLEFVKKPPARVRFIIIGVAGLLLGAIGVSVARQATRKELKR